MQEPIVLVSQPAEHVTRITLNRPQSMNALNAPLLQGLVQALRDAQTSRVIILEGAGDRSFCAGEDLKQTLVPKTGSSEELRDAFLLLQDITRLTSSSSTSIVIAAVQGYAIGGGAEIALAADFVIGGPQAKFRCPEVAIGHAVTGGISARLPQLVGLLRAKELLLTSRWVPAEDALTYGMLTELVEDPKARALELAVELATRPAASLAANKASLERACFPGMEVCLQDEVNAASWCFAKSDAAKAFTDFAARSAAKNGKTETVMLTVNGHGANQDKAQGLETVAAVAESVPSSWPRDINTAWQRAVANFGDKTFLRFGGKDHTFAQADMEIARLAGGLQDAGIKLKDRVAVVMRNSIEMVYTWLATNRLGAVWAPINVELKSITLQHVLSSAQPQLVIVDEQLVADVEATEVVPRENLYVNVSDESTWSSSTSPSLATLASLHNTGTAVATSHASKPSDTSAFLYTSGTTGKSKPCILSHEYFIIQATNLITGCGLLPTDVLYCPFPLFHADATALTTIPSILLGCVAALSPRFTASRFWDEIRASRATVYDFMGATLALVYKQPPSPRDTDHAVRLAWGVPVPTFAPDYERRFGHRLITLYGSVEASVPIWQDSSRPLPLGSCGRVLPGYQLRIADPETLDPLPSGTPGAMLMRADATNAFFHGYFGAGDATAAAMRGGWLATGDVGRVDSEGNVYFVGRAKDVIRRRGENINAAELEDEFAQHPAVLIAAAYAVPAALGEGTEDDVKVAVQLRPGYEPSVNEAELWEWARVRMARFQVPSVVEIVPEIRRTPTGKVEKHGLPVEGGVRFDTIR